MLKGYKLFAIGRILENGNYIKKLFSLEKNTSQNKELGPYFLKEFKELNIEEKNSRIIPVKICIGDTNTYVLCINGNILIKEIEENNLKNQINDYLEISISEITQDQKVDNNIENIKKIYSSDYLEKFVNKFNSLSNKIIKKFIDEINKEVNLEYNKFIETIKSKNQTDELLYFFKDKESNEGKSIFKYLKYRTAIAEKWIPKFINTKIESNSKGFLHKIISNNALYLPESIRNQYFNKFLSYIPKNYIEKIIQVDRYKAFNFYDKFNENSDKIPDIALNETIFGQVFNYYKEIEGLSFVLNKGNRLFKVELKKEMAIDVGGPYHEVISYMCNELQSNYLDLLIKTPNNKNDLGELRDKYMINPNSNKNIHKQAYEFIGKLMAMSISSGEALNLNLHPLIWKKILEIEITFEEYDSIDHAFFKEISDLEKEECKNKKEELINISDLHFVIQNSKESNIELIENGKETKVNLENLEKYINLAKSKRISEIDFQIDYIKKGLYSAIDKNILQIFNWNEFEEMVCGQNKLDIKDFKKNTEYINYNIDDDIIKWFWEWLENSKEEEKSKYLQFVSGRARLPKTGFGLEYKHKITKGGVESLLPSASTCDFTLKLPNYSSKNILIEKMNCAIQNCIEMAIS